MKKKKTLGIAVALAVIFLYANPLQAEQKTSLAFKSVFLSTADKSASNQTEKRPPDILFLTKLSRSSLGKAAADLEKNLKKIFNLQELSIRNESRETEISWESWKEKKKDHPKVIQTIHINGEEYHVCFSPEEIIYGDRLFSVRFLCEIYSSSKSPESDPLQSMDLVLKKEILWNFNEPLAIGFFFEDNQYFLTMTIWATVSSSGGRLGSSLTWIL